MHVYVYMYYYLKILIMSDETSDTLDKTIGNIIIVVPKTHCVMQSLQPHGFITDLHL